MELGEMTGYSWLHLGAVERGQAAPSEAVVIACERALAAGGSIIARFPELVREQAAQRHEREAARRHTAPTQPEPDIDWARLAAAAARPSTLSAATLNELESITDRQRVLYHELSSAQMLIPVEAHLSLLVSLLGSAQPDKTRRRLASAAGEAAGFAAWIWFDLGDQFKMSTFYRMAGDLLTEAGDTGLWSYVAGYRALTHEASGLGPQAVEHAAAALDRAPSATSRLTRSWLCAVAASAAALVGRHRADVLSLLAQARDHLDTAQAREPWMYDFDQTALAAYRGQCHLRLEQPTDAAAAFADGLANLPAERERRGAQLTAGLAEAHLRCGEADQALAEASVALDVFARRGSVSGLRRVRRLRDLLAEAGHHAGAAELNERVRAHLEVAS